MFLGTCGEQQAGDGAEGAEKTWRKHFYIRRQTKFQQEKMFSSEIS